MKTDHVTPQERMRMHEDGQDAIRRSVIRCATIIGYAILAASISVIATVAYLAIRYFQ